MGKIKKIAVRWGRFFCDGLTIKKNRRRDASIIFFLAVILAGILFSDRFYLYEKDSEGKESEVLTLEEVRNDELEKEIVSELKKAESDIDMSDWREHRNDWFGFLIKYPNSWKAPLVQSAARASQWDQKVQFRKAKMEADDSYVGFDVLVYNTSKVAEISDTKEFPLLKNGMAKEEGKCDTIEGHLFETGDYPAEEIYIGTLDDCYEPTLFFTFTKDQYIYNAVPVKKPGLDFLEDQRVEIFSEMPEFFAAVSTLENIDIVRKIVPRKAVVKKVISAPKPVVFKKDSLGRRVCNKKNDKPGKSKVNNKGKRHLDMECCLDPDEYPNPHCYYDPGKYGKYLK
ncbi:MAG TPA: hypothetical protein DIC35_01220 [Candidatus Moranbacteria bacterium]|nr:hypothetical protein [Candidatus Moranbacteria bacterium]